VIEHLIWAGAFDGLPGNRAQKTEELQRIIDLSLEHKKSVATGQMGLFSATTQEPGADPELYSYQPLAAWDEKTKLEKEREVVGFYLSAHPLDSYKKQLKWFNVIPFAESLVASQTATGTQEPTIIGCGLIQSSKVIVTKKGDRMAFVTLEDGVSKAEVILFPRTFKKVELLLSQHTVFMVRGTLDMTSPHVCKIKAQDFVPMDLLFEQWPTFGSICLNLPNSFEETTVQEVQSMLNRGKVPLYFAFSEAGKKLELSTRQRIQLNLDMLQKLERKKIGIKINL
jgi:DNA polymerase-3 subunit alpha